MEPSRLKTTFARLATRQYGLRRASTYRSYRCELALPHQSARLGDDHGALSCRQPQLVLAQVSSLRQEGKTSMTEPVTCEDCIHFRRDVINPSAGLGWCELRKVSRYPMQPHWCRQREVEDDAE